MSTQTIHFMKKEEFFPKIFINISYQENFLGTLNRDGISHGKRAIRVRVIEVSLYMQLLIRHLVMWGLIMTRTPFRNPF